MCKWKSFIEYLRPSLHGLARLAGAVILGAVFWPLICELGRGFGDPGAFHDAMLMTAVIAGAAGGMVGLVVGYSFNSPRARVIQMSSEGKPAATVPFG